LQFQKYIFDALCRSKKEYNDGAIDSEKVYNYFGGRLWGMC
jgi:hypothetical protein